MADIALFLQVTWIRKIRKNLWSQQVNDCPNWQSQATNLVKCRNKQKSQTMTFWTYSLKYKHVFPRRSAKMIDGTEKPKIPSNNKNHLWWAAITFSLDCSNFFYCWLWFCHHDSLCICYCISFRKMVRKVFWTCSEYKIMRNFIV